MGQDVLSWIYNISGFPEVIIHFFNMLLLHFQSQLPPLFMTAFWRNPKIFSNFPSWHTEHMTRLHLEDRVLQVPSVFSLLMHICLFHSLANSSLAFATLLKLSRLWNTVRGYGHMSTRRVKGTFYCVSMPRWTSTLYFSSRKYLSSLLPPVPFVSFPHFASFI